MSGRGARRPSILLGIVKIARGRADGLACFGTTPQAFLASLAPLIAFPLVGAAFSLVSAALSLPAEGPSSALTGLVVTICALLTPPVVSYELARVWRREESWLRFATAFNWCEWILPVVACLVMLPLGMAMNAGLSERDASTLLILALVAYGLWLHWFLARTALGLSSRQAVLMVVLVNLSTAFTVMAPHLLAREMT